MGLENIADSGVADLIADFSKFTLDPIEIPRSIFFSELQSQVDDYLTDSWPSKRPRDNELLRLQESVVVQFHIDSFPLFLGTGSGIPITLFQCFVLKVHG